MPQVQEVTRRISAELVKRKEMNKYATLLRQRLNNAVIDIQSGSGRYLGSKVY